MKGTAPRNDKAKPQNGIAKMGSIYDKGAGTAQKMTYGYYLLMPELLQRYSPKVYEISGDMIDQAMAKLKSKGLLEQELFDYEYVVYLSEPITENAKEQFSFEDEVNYLKNTIELFPSNKKLIYKPHPNDKTYKVDYIKENFSAIIINESKVPVEFILAKEPLIKEVVSYVSSTLIFAKKITGRNIKCNSLAKFTGIKLNQAYIDMMENSGVEFLK